MARLRDYTQSLMHPESDIERDEYGNLIIKQVQDMDPYQAGIQSQPDTPSPVDPDAKPIFMTNIPQGGFGPSYENPGGVPGSAQDRAQIDEQAAAAGSTVMDLSSKQKTPKPPAWVNPDVDLNAPGERDKFRQILVQDVLGGYDISTMNINAEMARSNLDPVIDKKAWDERFDRLTKEKLAAVTLMEQLMKPFDKAASQQEAIRKRNAETEKGQREAMDADEKRLIDLDGEMVKLAGERRKLSKEQAEAGMDRNNPAAMVSITRQATRVDAQQKRVQAEIERLEARLGRKAPAQAAAAQAPTTQTPTGKPTTKTPTSGTPQQTEAQRFAAEGKAKGWGPDQVLAEWKKLKTSGAGTKTPAARQTPSPARIVKPAPTYGELSEKQRGMKSDIDYAKQFLIDVGNFTDEMFIDKPAEEIMRLYNEMKNSVRDPRAGITSYGKR